MLPKIKIVIERWRYNKEYEMYVSNLGNFKDKNKQILYPKMTQAGYLSIKVGYRWMMAHRLVLSTWKPRPDADTQTVDHLDHNKRNNRLSNLEWVTQEENIRRAQVDTIKDPKEIEGMVPGAKYLLNDIVFSSIAAVQEYIETHMSTDLKYAIQSGQLTMEDALTKVKQVYRNKEMEILKRRKHRPLGYRMEVLGR